MHPAAPPRRLVAALAGLSCLLLPLLGHLPKAYAAMAADEVTDTYRSGVSRSPYEFTKIAVQYKG
ncbi:hypothetical protein ACH4CE_05895 [Streptomyces gelaticus]|uniref:hypothetical protein n=1 Tax=Streptomyces gelaticus TaxID=285446 RepID=UPI003793D4BE